MSVARQSFRIFHLAESQQGVIDLPVGGRCRVDLATRSPRLLAANEASNSPAIELETIHRDGRAYLAVRLSANEAFRLNGLPAPRDLVLRERDELVVGETLLVVSLHRVPYIGPAGEHHLAKECPQCLVPIGDLATIWICPTCLTIVHYGGPNDDPPLECIRTCSCCPCCQSEVILDPNGSGYVPEI